MSEAMQFFEYKHLPHDLQAPSKLIHDCVQKMLEAVPDNEQREHGLMKILEAKDCFVRAMLMDKKR